jgi:carbonic anhydrase
MDGRVQLPIINWIIANYEVKYVDMITTPGMDGILADKNNNIEDILEKINVSKEVHSTKHIFIVGHHDCLANPVNIETHKKHITDAVNRIKELHQSSNVIGLWLDKKSKVQIVNNI